MAQKRSQLPDWSSSTPGSGRNSDAEAGLFYVDGDLPVDVLDVGDRVGEVPHRAGSGDPLAPGVGTQVLDQHDMVGPILTGSAADAILARPNDG
jgi:hypothetical protein